MEVSKEMEEKLQAYLQEKGVEDILKDIVVDLCKETPEDVLSYMIEFLKKRQNPGGSANALGEDGPSTSDEEEEGEAPPPRRTSRRGAVSADVMDADELDNGEPLKIIPKEAAVMEALTKSVQENVLFQHLETSELKSVLDAMFEVSPKAGDIIIQQGDEGDNFYVIDNGTTEVLIGSEDGGEPELVGEITDGGSFGELALIYGTPRAATIRAKTDCHLWAIDRTTYRRILMGSTMKKRKTYEDFLGKVELLASLDKWEKLSVADALESAEFSASAVIMKQGDIGDAFFIIEEGECSVTITNEKGETQEVNQLTQADYFGELALLSTDGKRAATVTAVTDVKVAKLDRERFERVLGPCNDILARNAESYKKFMEK